MRFVLRSRLIDSAEYDAISSRLTLVLCNGQVREFGNVPEFVIKDLRAAESPGGYYMQLIRNKYPRLH